jgi:hypothetical protein
VREDEIQSSTSNIRVLPYVARKDERPDGVALTDMDGLSGAARSSVA